MTGMTQIKFAVIWECYTPHPPLPEQADATAKRPVVTPQTVSNVCSPSDSQSILISVGHIPYYREQERDDSPEA